MKVVKLKDKKRSLLLRREEFIPLSIKESVKRILQEVKKKKDRALLHYIRKYDGWNPRRIEEIYVPVGEIKKKKLSLSRDEKKALEFAGKRIERFHKRLIPNSVVVREKGILLEFKWTPVEKVGVYVPGGKASYPSSLLMTAIPAKVAGVKEVYCATPGGPESVSHALLYSAILSEVDGIFFMGGAHAVGAFAYGTQLVPRVDKIVGPGNIYVALAKKEVMGDVGVDSVAGPTEVMVIADETTEPSFVAADLLSQAEHDEMAIPVIITFSEKYAKEVLKELRRMLRKSPRKEIARLAIKTNGVCIVVENMEDAVSLAQDFAPEHLILAVKDCEKYADKFTKAGTVFLGKFTPESIGDYVAGPNHTLPTGGRTRFQSTLSTFDFLRAYNVVKCEKDGLRKLESYAVKIAEMEGLYAHAEAIKVRNI